jgi:hypothetical protein
MRIPHPTYSNVAATLALFVALGGTSFAAVSITGSDVKNGSLTGTDLKNESVTGSDVDNSSLTGSDIKSSSITSSDVKNGSLLAADFGSGQLPAGPAGPAGPPGPAGGTNVVAHRTQEVLGVGTIGTTTTQCPAGERATGGGAGVTGLAFNTYALDGEPIEADGTVPEDGDVITGWRASGFNGGVVPQTLTVTVLCAS